MKPKERTVQSFHENQKLLSAVNTVSTHTKLEMAGRFYLNNTKVITEAKETPNTFFKGLDIIVERVEKTGTQSLLEVDARRRQFIRNFIAAKHNYRIQSPSFRGKLSDVAQMIYSDKEADRQDILLVLEDFRIPIEEHIASDTEVLLGGI